MESLTEKISQVSLQRADSTFLLVLLSSIVVLFLLEASWWRGRRQWARNSLAKEDRKLSFLWSSIPAAVLALLLLLGVPHR